MQKNTGKKTIFSAFWMFYWEKRHFCLWSVWLNASLKHMDGHMIMTLHMMGTTHLKAV